MHHKHLTKEQYTILVGNPCYAITPKWVKSIPCSSWKLVSANTYFWVSYTWLLFLKFLAARQPACMENHQGRHTADNIWNVKQITAQSMRNKTVTVRTEVLCRALILYGRWLEQQKRRGKTNKQTKNLTKTQNKTKHKQTNKTKQKETQHFIEIKKCKKKNPKKLLVIPLQSKR